MNYCSIDDAWKNSNYISDQYKKYENQNNINNNIEHFESQSNHNINPNINHTINPNINHTINHNKYKCLFTCEDFIDHLNNCHVCRNKIRQKFSSKLLNKLQNKLQNIILDNKDTVLLILIALFILIFFNLLLSIFKK